MKRLFFLVMFIGAVCGSFGICVRAHAQADAPSSILPALPEVPEEVKPALPPPAASASPAPAPGGAGNGKAVCGSIRSTIPFKIYGTLATDRAGEKDGVAARHKSTFTLSEGESLKVCSEGPFFKDQRLELTLRTMFPVFSCRTKIDREIVLSAAPRPEGGYDYKATCF